MMMNPVSLLFAAALFLSVPLHAAGTLCVNGRPAGAEMMLPQGVRVMFSAKGTGTGERLTLRERDTGLVWYEGSAADCRATAWLFRPETVALEAVFSPAEGTSRTQGLTLSTHASKAAVLYPGLSMELLRREPKMPLLPPEGAFRPRGPAVAAAPAGSQEAAGYPAFRTAESVVEAKGPFRLPDYWRRPLPDVRFGDVPGVDGAVSVPVSVPDLGRADVAARIEGFILTERPGTYAFRMVTTCMAEMRVAGQRLTVSGQRPGAKHTGKDALPPPFEAARCMVRLPAGAIPFAVTLTARDGVAPAFALLWQEPGTTVWMPVPPERFLHAVPSAAERFYVRFTDGHAGRTLAVKRGGGAPAFSAEPPEIPDAATYRPAAAALLKRFAETGDSAAADLLLRWAQAYFSHARRSYGGPRFLWLLDGSQLRDAETLRPFLETCLRLPAFQSRALSVRLETLRLCEPVFNRTCLGELHNGTNDAYGEDNNFTGNLWRVGRVWDDPLAYDAARSLFDNHFSYCWAVVNGMESDDTFNFHSANGRQLNMGAYGRDWLNRVINFRNVGTPWGNTRRQYERLARYVLAYEWFLYRGAMAFCANGRHNVHKGSLSPDYAKKLLALPEDCLSAEIRAALSAQIARLGGSGSALEGNRFFFRQLLAVHRRADYYLDVKLNSPLVGGTETFAGQNPGNLSFGDGVTTLLRNGTEYDSIHRYSIPDSLWRFRALSGTTQLDEEWGGDHPWKGLDRYRTGSGARAGGVSDGTLGHCGFEFVSHGRNATRARKLFVFTEDGMFVLGGGITGSKSASEPFTYRSNLTQTSFVGPLTLHSEKGDSALIPAGMEEKHLVYSLTQRFWIEHDGIGYLVIPSEAEADREATLHIRVSVRTPLNRLIPRVIDAADSDMQAYKAKCATLTDQGRRAVVLELWVDHGSQPKDATVAYYICMRPENFPQACLLKTPPVDILANDATCQAVKDLASGAVHTFFYEPGTLSAAPRVGVDRPAALMLRPAGKGWRLTAQDPVAACSGDLSKMTDCLTVTFPGFRKAVPLPGAGDPDDRRRGAPVTILLGNPR